MIGRYLGKTNTWGNLLALARGHYLPPIQHNDGISLSSLSGGYDAEQSDRNARRGRRITATVLLNASEELQGSCNLSAWFCLDLTTRLRARRKPLPCPVPSHQAQQCQGRNSYHGNYCSLGEFGGTD